MHYTLQLGTHMYMLLCITHTYKCYLKYFVFIDSIVIILQRFVMNHNYTQFLSCKKIHYLIYSIHNE